MKYKVRSEVRSEWRTPEVADPLKRRSLYNENFISTFNGIRMIPITPKPNRFDEPNGFQMKPFGKRLDRKRVYSKRMCLKRMCKVNAQRECSKTVPRLREFFSEERPRKMVEENVKKKIGPIKAESGGSLFRITFVMASIVSYVN